MSVQRLVFVTACVMAICIVVATASAAPVVWTGPTITFTKPGGADPSQPANQDRLTPLVALTRASSQGIFNIAQEAASTANSPAGTLWATDINNPSQAITAANFAALNFTTWQNAYGGSGSLNANLVGRDAVVHLVTEDVYLNVRFTSFGNAAAGAPFSYQRSTAVPEPSGVFLSLTTALAGWGFLRTRVGQRHANIKNSSRDQSLETL